MLNTITSLLLGKIPKLLAAAFMLATSFGALAAAGEPAHCSDIAELLKFVGRTDFFDQLPQDFIKNSASFLRVVKIEDGGGELPNENLRKITLAAKNGNWLTEGYVEYDILDSTHSRFYVLEINFRPSCFAQPENLLTLAATIISPTFREEKGRPPYPLTTRFWTSPAPNEDTQRDIMVTAGHVLWIKALQNSDVNGKQPAPIDR